MTSIADRNLTFEEMEPGTTSQTKGFYVKSTAPINVEDKPWPVERTFDEVEALITHTLLSSDDPQISIYVHGYSVRHDQARPRSQALYNTAKTHNHPGQIVIGFLWPSEHPIRDTTQLGQKLPFIQKIRYAFESLPTVLLVAIATSLITTLVGIGLLVVGSLPISGLAIAKVALPAILLSAGILVMAKAVSNLWFWMPLHGLIAIALLGLMQLSWGPAATLIITIVATLIFGALLGLLVLRLVTYLRDRERAAYFAVYDLVELIRKIDGSLQEARDKQDSQRDYRDRPRVKLNFMAHSLGNMVVTNAIRILSDVFDAEALAKNPPSTLGKTMTLERMVLIAPDIPIEAILPGRSNFLSSTISRCAEPYVFTSEGDLALRLASTAANYVGYFSRQRFGGYRLGNITARRPSKPIPYGILNLQNHQCPHHLLDLRASKREKKTLDDLFWERDNLLDPNNLPMIESEWDKNADKITYFDCTDYRDILASNGGDSNSQRPSQVKPLLISAPQNKAFSFLDYSLLLPQYLVLGSVDTHAGYFVGDLSQMLLHELTLSGFSAYLSQSYDSSINQLHQVLQQKQIQMILSQNWTQKYALRRPVRPSSIN